MVALSREPSLLFHDQGVEEEAPEEGGGPRTILIRVSKSNFEVVRLRCASAARPPRPRTPAYGLEDVEIAFRESETRPLAGPILSAPVNDFHPLKSVIDSLTSTLSLPIAGLKTLSMEGSLGFYFKVGEDLYGVTAWHMLFPETHGNDTYSYDNTGPKKHVVLMGNRGFRDLLDSTQKLIGTLNTTAKVLEKNVKAYTARVAAADSAKYQQRLKDTKATVVALKSFFATLKKDWSDIKDRIIGHVVWSPPLIGTTPSNTYTRNVCVIKLDKNKFLPNLRGNAIDLGTEIESGTFVGLLYPRDDVHSEFEYPEDRMHCLRTILAVAKIKEPNSQDAKGDPTRFVIKRDPKTLTTVGRLNGFESYVRRHGLLGSYNSIEAAVFPYDNDSGPFSRGGDSGAAIVGANNDFVAQLTGAAGVTDSSDITYGTPMEWLWEQVIKNSSLMLSSSSTSLPTTTIVSLSFVSAPYLVTMQLTTFRSRPSQVLAPHRFFFFFLNKCLSLCPPHPRSFVSCNSFSCHAVPAAAVAATSCPASCSLSRRSLARPILVLIGKDRLGDCCRLSAAQPLACCYRDGPTPERPWHRTSLLVCCRVEETTMTSLSFVHQRFRSVKLESAFRARN